MLDDTPIYVRAGDSRRELNSESSMANFIRDLAGLRPGGSTSAEGFAVPTGWRIGSGAILSPSPARVDRESTISSVSGLAATLIA